MSYMVQYMLQHKRKQNTHYHTIPTPGPIMGADVRKLFSGVYFILCFT